MYCTTDNIVTFFIDENAKHTAKTYFGKISEAIKSSEEDEKSKYDFEIWYARFVGDAFEKAKTLSDKASIKLTKFSIRNPFNKDKGRSYPHLIIFDFEVYEKDMRKNPK